MIDVYDIALWLSGFLGGVGVAVIVLHRASPRKSPPVGNRRVLAIIDPPGESLDRDPDFWKGDHA